MPFKNPEAARAWRATRREHINARKRELYATNPAVRARCLEQASAGRSKRRYGLMREQVEAQRLKQRGICALCPRPATCIDHDHSSGRFRGLLCRQCNAALGTLGDCAAGLLRAIDYLTRY